MLKPDTSDIRSQQSGIKEKFPRKIRSDGQRQTSVGSYCPLEETVAKKIIVNLRNNISRIEGQRMLRSCIRRGLL